MRCCRLTGAALPAAIWGVAATIFLGAAVPCVAHDDGVRAPIVIDTDLGIDDAVALAMALQNPDLEIAAMVASEGVADPAGASDLLSRLAQFFNRADVPLFEAMSSSSRAQPECRQRAATVISEALPEDPPDSANPFSPQAYSVEGIRNTVLVLGPLTQLAAALDAAPEVAAGIGRIVVAGDPERSGSWNLAWDPEAVTTVGESGVPVIFVRPGVHATKPDGWFGTTLAGGQRCALGEILLERLLRGKAARTHYLENLPTFHDELAVLYLVQPELFRAVAPGIVEPGDSEATASAITAALSRGRQSKDRVVFIDGPLPLEVLQLDLRARRDAILANNGPDEWFAQLLLNELHEHLGAYSIIGVKMGLRAAEILNAPQHAMTVVSAAPPTQPVSCLNDGLIVSTGSTPGRGLFSHVPGPPGTVEATFEYNGRTMTLRLEEEYRTRIRSAIKQLLACFSLEDDAYWSGVRELGLDIWQDWHRSDLFQVVSDDPVLRDQSTRGRQ